MKKPLLAYPFVAGLAYGAAGLFVLACVWVFFRILLAF